MLIVIPADLEQEIDSILTTPEGRSCFDNLAIAHRKGTHLVSGSPALIRRILNSMQGDAQGVFRKIAQKHHEQAALIGAVTDYVIVGPRATPAISCNSIAGRKAYKVSFEIFSHFESIHPSRVIAEDSSDSEVYTSVAFGYLHHQRAALKGVRCRLQPFGGGGSSTADQFETHAKHGPTIALVDSDKRAPMGPLGSTAQDALQRSRILSAECICDVEILPSHELDNLIPADLLADCLTLQDSAEFRMRWLNLIAAGALRGTDDVLYLDLKAGIQGNAVHTSEYVRAAAKMLCPEAVNKCTCDPPNTCSCTYLDGLGTTAVRRAAKALALLTPQKISEYFFSTSANVTNLPNIWSALGRRLVSWGVAAPPVRA